MIDPDRQKEQFAKRLQRISAGGENTMGQIYVGPVDEEKVRKKKSKRAAAGLPSMRETVGYPASIVLAFFLGMLAVLITRYVRYAMAGSTLTGEDADITMAIDAGLALAIGFVLKQMFRLSGKISGNRQDPRYLRDDLRDAQSGSYLAGRVRDRVFAGMGVGGHRDDTTAVDPVSRRIVRRGRERGSGSGHADGISGRITGVTPANKNSPDRVASPAASAEAAGFPLSGIQLDEGR